LEFEICKGKRTPKNTLVLFDLTKDQIAKILSSDRQSNGLYVELEDITKNPYILCEQFTGDDPDDRISFNKIDRGIIPSPELGLEKLNELDSGERLRALCVEKLKKESKHTFIELGRVIHDINRKLSYFPEWKRHQYTERYFEVDEEILSQALVFRLENNRKYMYLKLDYEDERKIEEVIKSLAKRTEHLL